MQVFVFVFEGGEKNTIWPIVKLSCLITVKYDVPKTKLSLYNLNSVLRLFLYGLLSWHITQPTLSSAGQQQHRARQDQGSIKSLKANCFIWASQFLSYFFQVVNVACWQAALKSRVNGLPRTGRDQSGTSFISQPR